ncbi:hypothetical protein BC936DRAFT_144720 [Jimgerdemannia flammicorona]|uniref:Uncharacterized protein n=1 Tax=Jimgerdemannia flammicorona TaxID=994334 RepID=A0A433DBW3_9FUNG|nr:hypothetical protein BC936DRAFT_144720 [Jimgerdemannia flammicorona]
MYGKEFSPEFLEQQTRDKTGPNNPVYGRSRTFLKWFPLILDPFPPLIHYGLMGGTTAIHCESMEVVVWGENLASNVGMGRFTQLVSSMFCQMGAYVL